MPAEAVAPARAYKMTLRVSAVEEAATLAQELELARRAGRAATARSSRPSGAPPRPTTRSMWDEREFPELRFFLRAWAGGNAARQLVVLDERPIAC